MTFHPGYALTALAIFAIEVVIALYVHDALVRPYIGDSLAVILVYAALRAVTPLRVVPALAIALATGFLVELGQLLNILDLLHLRSSAVARILLGSDFEFGDLLAYTGGAAFAWLVERLR